MRASVAILWLFLRWSHAQQGLTCPLSLLIPFHDDRPGFDNPSILTATDHEHDGVALLATAFMALEDFNRRESLLVPELSNYKGCQIFYPQTLNLVDTGLSADRVTKTKDIWMTESTCAVVGPVSNQAAEIVGAQLLGSSIPAIAFGARAPLLTNGNFFPNLALGNVDWGDAASKLCQYALSQRRNLIGVMYTPGDNLDDEDYASVWEDAYEETGVTVRLALIWNRSRQEFREQLVALKNRGVYTIVVALERDDNVETLADVANSLGMLSEDYLWIFMDSFVSPQHVDRFNTSTETPLGRLLEGSRIFQLLDGLVPAVRDINQTAGTNITDDFAHFKEEWETRGSGIVNQLNVFLQQSDGMLYGTNVTVEDDFFLRNNPSYGSGYIYDAIISIGMSVCDGISILNSEHEGPCGVYRFLNRSLDAEELTFGVFFTEINSSNGKYQAVLRDITILGEWETIPEPETTPPVDEGLTDEYYASWAFIMSVVFASFAILFSIGCCYFVYYFRKNRIVSVGQPEFLYVACFGAFLIAVGSMFLGFDESNGWDEKKLDRKCITMTWCHYLGNLVVYMALFSKLWRVQKVTQMRRRQKVEVKHVLAPFAAILVATFVILFVYTFVDPPTWVRVPIGDGDTESTFGRCQQSTWFEVVLDLLLTFAVAISAWQAWKTRELPEDISDAKRVWQTLIAHLAILIVGLVFILTSSLVENGTFLFLSELLVDFCSSVTSIAFLVGPKMYYVYRFKKTGEMPTGLQRGRTRISGLAPPTSSATGRYGPSSHITFNHGVDPSSMASSGISGTSALSCISQSDYGNQSNSRFGSFRLSKASENAAPRDSPRKASNALPQLYSRPGESSSLAMSSQLSSQQESPIVSKALMVDHTGIPTPPTTLEPQTQDTKSTTPIMEISHQSNESSPTPSSKPTDDVPAPPIVSDSPEASDRPPPTGETAPGMMVEDVPHLSMHDGAQEVTNEINTEIKTAEEARSDNLEMKLAKELQGAIEESTETLKA